MPDLLMELRDFNLEMSLILKSELMLANRSSITKLCD